MKKHIFYLLPLLAFAACTSNDLIDLDGKDKTDEIQLTSGIGNVTPVSRSVVAGLPENTDKLGVTIVRLDATDNNATPTFPGYASLTEVLNMKAADIDKDGKVAFTASEYYLANGYKTRLIGFYPALAASVATYANGKVTFTINGDNDIMLTAPIEGSKATADRFGASKPLEFNHVLTQIRVKAYAEDQAAIDAWGGITDIIVESQNKVCEITLPGTQDSEISYPSTGAGALNIIKKDAGNKSAAITYPADGSGLLYPIGAGNPVNNAVACGYSMIQPVKYVGPIPGPESGILKLTVKTKKGGDQSVSIKQNLVKGTAYTVTLKFTSTIIEPSATITPWTDGGNTEVEM